MKTSSILIAKLAKQELYASAEEMPTHLILFRWAISFFGVLFFGFFTSQLTGSAFSALINLPLIQWKWKHFLLMPTLGVGALLAQMLVYTFAHCGKILAKRWGFTS